MFGYFPTYTIGSLYAAQLMKTYSQSHDLKNEIRAGQFTPLREWLAKNIYETANRQSAEQIMAGVTGHGLDTSAFFEHLASADRIGSDR
jgi:carboxypeptidase Taq